MELSLFTPEQLKSVEQLVFEQSPLGKIHAQIPFRELALRFTEHKPPRHNGGGRPPRLSIEGGLGLMFLKHYLGLSDKLLIERLNSDRFLQLFCFTTIPLNDPIRDKDLAGRWRRFFGIHMEIEDLQDDLANHWRANMNNECVLMNDATCYESDIKYPTDIKLLTDCCQWIFDQIKQVSRFYKMPLPKADKFKNTLERVASYQRLKRKPKGRRRRLCQSLLYWLCKWLEYFQHMLDKGGDYHKRLDPKVYARLKVARTIYQQQSYMHKNNVRSVRHRIVSLYKPYLRPIIRGKERKRYEFGAKVHMSQVDGLNFIEHLSFEAFHEGIRMWTSIHKHRKRFGKCSQYAGDKIYATNANRKKAKKQNIQTSFLPKGRKAKDEEQRKQTRLKLAKARSTCLEGSFGTEKRNYGVGRVKARLMETEIAWIFFAVHTANAVRFARRIEKRESMPKARAA